MRTAPDPTAALAGAFPAMLSTMFRTFWPLLLLLAVAYAYACWRRWRELRSLAESGIEQIDAMDGQTFEKYLEALFGRLGYAVERTRYARDGGADLVARKDGRRLVIQAKRYRGKVGVAAVGEVLRAKTNYGCEEAMTVTNSAFTEQTRAEARRNGIELWDRQRLIQALLAVRRDGGLPAPGAPAVPATSAGMPPGGGPCAGSAPATPTGQRLAVSTCARCGRAVSEKVERYCLERPARFGGAVYCFEHQRGVRKHV